jgi:hypothetical protein
MFQKRSDIDGRLDLKAQVREFSCFLHHDPEFFVEIILANVYVADCTLVHYHISIALHSCSLLVNFQLQSLSHYIYRTLDLTICQG